MPDRARALQEAAAKDYFRLLDVNRDGYISLKDLQVFMDRSFSDQDSRTVDTRGGVLRVSRSEIQGLMGKMANERLGRLAVNQFESWLRHNREVGAEPPGMERSIHVPHVHRCTLVLVQTGFGHVCAECRGVIDPGTCNYACGNGSKCPNRPKNVRNWGYDICLHCFSDRVSTAALDPTAVERMLQTLEDPVKRRNLVQALAAARDQIDDPVLKATYDAAATALADPKLQPQRFVAAVQGSTTPSKLGFRREAKDYVKGEAQGQLVDGLAGETALASVDVSGMLGVLSLAKAAANGDVKGMARGMGHAAASQMVLSAFACNIQ